MTALLLVLLLILILGGAGFALDVLWIVALVLQAYLILAPNGEAP